MHSHFVNVLSSFDQYDRIQVHYAGVNFIDTYYR